MKAVHYLWPLIFLSLLIASLFVTYTGYDREIGIISPEKVAYTILLKDPQHTMGQISSVMALAGLGLIAFALLLGQFYRMFGPFVKTFIHWRKFIGISGYVFFLWHVVFSGAELLTGLGRQSHPGSILLLFGSAFIFSVMVFTSNRQALVQLGYKKWKLVQKSGYLGLGMGISHMLLQEASLYGGLGFQPYALIFLFVGIVALALRVGLLLISVPEGEDYEELLGEKPTTEHIYSRLSEMDSRLSGMLSIEEITAMEREKGRPVKGTGQAEPKGRYARRKK